MIDSFTLQTALRTQALTLSVASCSGVDLSAGGAIYTRASGSFLTDGFSAGMEVLGAGFSNSGNNASYTVTRVSASDLTVDGALTTESAGSGKTLTVGLPQYRAWEDIKFEPTDGAPWIAEELVPGPTRQISVGAAGTLEERFLYILTVHVPENVGIGAPRRYATGVKALFTPLTQIVVGSYTARVRTDTGPYEGALLRRRPGWVSIPVTIPIEIWSPNTV